MSKSEGSLIRSERPAGGWLESWSPFSSLEDFFREARLPSITYPPVDIAETDGQYVLSAEIPGVEKKDVTIECKDGVLHIHGEKRSQREEATDKARLLERSYGAFSRALGLPDDADTDRIEASFRDGVLRVEIQKKPAAKPKTVAIKD